MYVADEKIADLYINIVSKWDDDQFKKFIEILKQLGDRGAYEIFTAEGAEVYLTRNEVYCLKEQMNKVIIDNKRGAYEGITFEDENAANTIVKNFAECSISSWGEFASGKSLEERRAIVPRIKKFLTGITRGDIWYNNSKQSLPRNYIERRMTKTNDYGSVKKTFLELVIEQTDELLFLVDPPGMGKSSELTKLEMDFRKIEGFAQRIIIRINLNQFCGTLQKMANRQLTLKSFIEQFVLYIPLQKLKNNTEFERVPVFVLLDGLDEVLPEYKETMLNLLRGLLGSSNDSDKLFVRKVVLTTRPHLRELIEQEFKVQSYSLCPLEEMEKVLYLYRSLKSTNPSIEIAHLLIYNLRSEVQVLLSNPLMLHLYSEICSDEMSAEVIDLYSLYSMFIDRKHESYLLEK